jgi:hypothetical protein
LIVPQWLYLAAGSLLIVDEDHDHHAGNHHQRQTDVQHVPHHTPFP